MTIELVSVERKTAEATTSKKRWVDVAAPVLTARPSALARMPLLHLPLQVLPKRGEDAHLSNQACP